MTRLSREVPVYRAHAALLIVDVQNYCVSGKFEKTEYFRQSLRDTALPNIRRLQHACRRAGVEVIYSVIENMTRDGRDRGLECAGAGVDRHIVQRIGEGRPIGIRDLPHREFVERLARERTKAGDVERLQGNSNDAAAGNKAGAGKMEQTRQQLTFRQVAGGADEHDDLGLFGTDASVYFCQIDLVRRGVASSDRRSEL